MYCPYCDHPDHLEIDLHADGFSANLLECTECGALLTSKGPRLETVHGPVKSPVAATSRPFRPEALR